MKLKRLALMSLSLMIVFSVCLFTVACGGRISVDLYCNDTLFKTASVSVNSKYKFDVPNLIGYDFLGWYSDVEGGNVFTDSKGNSASMTWKEDNPTTLYAHLQAKKYDINLNYCGATALDNLKTFKATYDDKVANSLPVPQKKGFSFDGWFTNKINGTQITDSNGNFMPETQILNEKTYPISDDGITLFAHWGEKKVKYIFSTNDGSPVKEVTNKIGEVLYNLPASIKDNYCFEGWYFDSTFLNKLEYPYTIADTNESTITLYAKFIPASINVLSVSKINNDREYEVSYNGNDMELIIPDMYYGTKITSVKKITSTTLKKVVLPQSVNTLSMNAFNGCSALENVNIPNQVTQIPKQCFSGCEKLQKIYIPNDANLIGEQAFYNCSSIKELILPEKLNVIQKGAFRNMASLEKFVISENCERFIVKDGVLYNKMGNSLNLVQYPAKKAGNTYAIDDKTIKIKEYAFSSCVLKTITINDKISEIEEGAFENCNSLIFVQINSGDNEIIISDNAFKNCSNLKALKIVSNKIPKLLNNVFDGVNSNFCVYVATNLIKNYKLSSGWRNIADSIFSNSDIYGDFAVENVTGGFTIKQYFGSDDEVVIPEVLNANKIVEIKENAFAFCSINKVIINKNISNIGSKAFYKCTNLVSIVMQGDPPVLASDAFSEINQDFGIYVDGSLELLDSYKVANVWKDYASKLGSYIK